MKFADVLASSIHDIKNALGMVLNTLEDMSSDPNSALAGDPKAVILQLEARRANNDLIQLLTLYKFDNGQLSTHMVEHNLEDFLEEIVVDHRALSAARGIEIAYQADPYLSAYFDEDLLRGVLNNAIGNAERYTQDRILLVAQERENYLVIGVEDNGAGFPQAMLDMLPDMASSESFSRGRTQLGLYFSHQVAEVHRNGERHGRITLDNNSSLGGGCFSVWLP
jgi:signal transduction histidine kinase